MENNPIILSEDKHSLTDLDQLRLSRKIWRETDQYNSQLEELFYIQNPASKIDPDDKKLKDFIAQRTSVDGRFFGSFVYFPWNGNLVHILSENEYFQVRTNRNRNIITSEEQKKLYDTNIAVVGLSIGGMMALNLAYSGIARNMKLADFDTLELSNLNRTQVSAADLGEKKSDAITRRIYEVNPYASLLVYPEGLSNSNLTDFIHGAPKPELIFEEIDDFEMKIRLRLEAKKAGVPVIMLTNLGDRMLVDVERYDLDRSLPIFNGLIGDLDREILDKPISEEDKKKYAVLLVGKESLPDAVFKSVMEINKTLVGRPQVMSTAALGSGLASYLARKLFLGELKSGRTLIDLTRHI